MTSTAWLRRPASTLAIVAGLTLASSASALAQATHAEELLAAFTARVESRRSQWIDVRRDLHRHPELSGQEARTAGIVADHLRAAGFEVRTGVGGHGVVGVLRGGADGPMLAFRADMDAARSSDPDPVAFASEVPGVRHICGHDIHTTIGLALADGLAAVREDLRGSVMMIFQPAEESARGARAMLADGIFAGARPDAIFAYHTTPYEVGQIAAAPEVQMAGRDAVRVSIRGGGDLEDVANQVREIVAATATLPPEQAFQPQADDFVLAQGVRVGRSGDEWRVMATFTTSSRGRSEQARDEILQGLEAMESRGVEIDLDYQVGWVAGVTNSPELVRTANASAMAVLGETAVHTVGTLVPAFSEDFGSFQDEVPGVMYFLGVSNSERGWVGMPHSPDYVADEESIFVGARTMAAIFLDLHEDGLPEGIEERE